MSSSFRILFENRNVANVWFVPDPKRAPKRNKLPQQLRCEVVYYHVLTVVTIEAIVHDDEQARAQMHYVLDCCQNRVSLSFLTSRRQIVYWHNHLEVKKDRDTRF